MPQYLSTTSSPMYLAGSRHAWRYRCLASCLLVGAGFVATNWFLGGRFDHFLSLPLALIVLALLPRPRVKGPLMASRSFVALTLLASMERLYKWVGSEYPLTRDSAWMAAYPFTSVLLMLGLCVWIWSTFWTKSAKVQTTLGSPQQSVTTEANTPRLTFTDVGGLAEAKREALAIARNRFNRQRSQITRNGILFYGPQGTGKNLLAEAIAGECRAHFVHVRCPELVGQNTGSGAERIRAAFDSASKHRPIVLFLDEIDSIGSRKQVQGYGTDTGGGGREYNALVTQLMQSIDQYRAVDGLLIVAATNYLDGLEPTLIRDGRFDAKIRLDLPNEAGRKEILLALLNKHPWVRHDLTSLAKRTPSWSPARLKSLVDRAAILAGARAIEERHIIEALESTGGRDQDTLESVSWEDVVLPTAVSDDLRSLLSLLRPGRAEELSLPAPTGLILVGPPGTGKTMIARLIATKARRSFYAVNPSDVLAGAIGGSVKRLAEIFRRAKENAPSIVFFDEMDSLFPVTHGQTSQHDIQLVEQALIEISALKPEHQVFLIGTTNYLERMDPRMLRGGRFSEKVEIPLPDQSSRERLVTKNLGSVRLSRSLTISILANRLEGLAPADIEAVIHAMKRVAMRRMDPNARQLPELVLADLEEAVNRVQPQF